MNNFFISPPFLVGLNVLSLRRVFATAEPSRFRQQQGGIIGLFVKLFHIRVTWSPTGDFSKNNHHTPTVSD